MMYSCHTQNRWCGATSARCKVFGGRFFVKTKLLTAIVAAGLAASPALAAPPPPVANAYDWSGPYIGGFFGYDWGRTRVIDNGVLTESGARTNGALGGVLLGYN